MTAPPPRRALLALVPWLLAMGCDAFAEPAPQDFGGSDGVAVGASPGVGGSDACPQFRGNSTSSTLPTAPVLYSWISAEEANQLRESAEPFPSPAAEVIRPRGLEELSERMASPPDLIHAELIPQILGQLADGRSAWPHPWATLPAVVDGATATPARDRLLRLVLRQEAWIALFNGPYLRVIDALGIPVDLGQALAVPERIGALFYDPFSTGELPTCSDLAPAGEVYREFVVGNAEMLERWSLGGPDITNRLASDRSVLTSYLADLRGRAGLGAAPAEPLPFAAGCAWHTDLSCYDPYVRALSWTLQDFAPEVGNVAQLIDALGALPPQGDEFSAMGPEGGPVDGIGGSAGESPTGGTSSGSASGGLAAWGGLAGLGGENPDGDK